MTLDEKHKFTFPPVKSHDLHDVQHDVYFGGEGPAVILMHELPGMDPACLKVADRIVQWGFKVYMPLFFGSVGQNSSALGTAQLLFCLQHEFNLFHANAPSRIADWLRALSRKISQDHGGQGIGVIGMCLTGNIVLSMMTEDCVKVPVMCEPALPFLHKAALGVPDADVYKAQQNAVNSPILAYRFTTDCISPAERFCTLRDKFQKNIQTTEIPTGKHTTWKIKDGSHPVLTGDYADQDDCNHPVNHVFDEILGRLSRKLKGQPNTIPACPTP